MMNVCWPCSLNETFPTECPKLMPPLNVGFSCGAGCLRQRQDERKHLIYQSATILLGHSDYYCCHSGWASLSGRNRGDYREVLWPTTFGVSTVEYHPVQKMYNGFGDIKEIMIVRDIHSKLNRVYSRETVHFHHVNDTFEQIRPSSLMSLCDDSFQLDFRVTSSSSSNNWIWNSGSVDHNLGR